MTTQKFKICVLLFLLAAGVRLLVWQNNKLEMDGVQRMVTHTYKEDARRLAAGSIAEFVVGPDPPADASIPRSPRKETSMRQRRPYFIT